MFWVLGRFYVATKDEHGGKGTYAIYQHRIAHSASPISQVIVPTKLCNLPKNQHPHDAHCD
jgi:hypothetical protein